MSIVCPTVHLQATIMSHNTRGLTLPGLSAHIVVEKVGDHSNCILENDCRYNYGTRWSKCFDNVPQTWLLHLDYHRIGGSTHKWINS